MDVTLSLENKQFVHFLSFKLKIEKNWVNVSQIRFKIAQLHLGYLFDLEYNDNFGILSAYDIGCKDGHESGANRWAMFCRRLWTQQLSSCVQRPGEYRLKLSTGSVSVTSLHITSGSFVTCNLFIPCCVYLAAPLLWANQRQCLSHVNEPGTKVKKKSAKRVSTETLKSLAFCKQGSNYTMDEGTFIKLE